MLGFWKVIGLAPHAPAIWHDELVFVRNLAKVNLVDLIVSCCDEVIALLLALFMPDIWVLAGVNDTVFIDVARVSATANQLEHS